ncbi:hypothetical protein [Streptomyces sp. NBC_00057]
MGVSVPTEVRGEADVAPPGATPAPAVGHGVTARLPPTRSSGVKGLRPA